MSACPFCRQDGGFHEVACSEPRPSIFDDVVLPDESGADPAKYDQLAVLAAWRESLAGSRG